MTIHFPKPGDYTDEVFSQVIKRIEKGDIKQVIVATTAGNTALKAADSIKGVKLIAVTHQAGFKEPGGMEIPLDVIEELKSKGVIVVTATHALAGVDRAIRKKHGTWMTTELIAETLRIFGQGTKVCAEIVMMAADAGVIDMDNLIAIGGTGRGADTAWVVKPAHSHAFFDMRLKELICKP
ncbi:MAG: pyruvate kinase alpha/beta domain-containing protein [Candidatus Heimdallarchaeaceae archaeon]